MEDNWITSVSSSLRVGNSESPVGLAEVLSSLKVQLEIEFVTPKVLLGSRTGLLFESEVAYKAK